MDTAARWMEERHLALAPEKTEAVPLLGRRRCGPLTGLTLRGCVIEPKKMARYLGVTLDQGLTFAPHIQHAMVKALRAVAGLSRLMPRTRGANEGRRRLLAAVATSIALYGAPVWAEVLRGRQTSEECSRHSV